MTGQEELLDFVDLTARMLCDRPGLIELETHASENMLSILVNCDPADISKVIGRQGRNISALRLLAQAIAAKHRIKVTIMLKE
jgi:predicted RNA-binding protein YlqC (UPF0109 family)